MRKIDWYIIRKFLGTFAFILGLFVIISVVIDFSERVDDFLNTGASLRQIIFNNYLPFCLAFGNQLSPFLIFLAVLWVTSRMAQQSELIAITSAGVSYNRMLRPFIIAGTVVVLLILVFGHFVIPVTNRIKFDFDRTYIFGQHNFGRDIYREIQPGHIYYFDWIDEGKQLGYHFSKETWQDSLLTEKILANRARYNAEKDQWTLIDGQIRTISALGEEHIRKIGTLDTTLNMVLEDFGRPDEVIRNQITPDLYAFREKLLKSGDASIVDIDLEIHSRTSRAFTILILTLIGVSLASRKRRGGIGVSLLLAILVSAVFLFTERMTQVAAVTSVGLPVMFAVWIPNIIFAGVAFVIYLKAPK